MINCNIAFVLLQEDVQTAARLPSAGGCRRKNEDNIMKKFMTVTLFLAAMCAFTGCGSSRNQSAESTTAAELSTEEEALQVTPVEMEASEYVELGDYKNLTVTVEKREISDEDVEEEINNFIEGYVDYEEVADRDTVQEGDYVNVDYTCTIDGKENDEYSDTNVDLKAADGEMDEYLGAGLGDDFELESKVIGSKKGSTVTVGFTFPKDYDDDAVAGKKCKMEVKINAINQEVVPELTDAFVKENTDSNTVAEYKESVRQNLEEEAAAEAEEMGQEQVWEQILSNARQKKDFSADMIQQEIENLKIENQEFAEFYMGIDVEEYLTESSGMTMEELAKESLKGQCVQELIAKAEKITVTDDELQEEMEAIATESGLESADEVKELYSEEDVRSQLLSQKLLDKIMSYTTVKTTPATTEAAEETDE